MSLMDELPSPLSDDFEVVSKPTDEAVKTAQVIHGLFGFELAVHIIALILNCVIFSVMRVYKGYHVHLRVLLRNMTLALIFASGYNIARSYLFFKDWNRGEDSYMAFLPENGCGFIWQLPLYSCILLCFYPIATVVERNLATLKYTQYEHVENTPNLEYFCLILSFPFILLIPYYASFVWSERNSQLACELNAQKTPIFLRNGGNIIMAIFSFICSKHFELLIRKNEAAKKEYIENNYSSISPRYQLRENAVTCELLLKGMRAMCALCLLPLIVGVFYMEAKTDDEVERILQSAIWFLSSAPITLILPLILLFFDDRLLRRAVDNARLALRYFYSPPYIALCSSSSHSSASSFMVDTA